MKIPDTIIRASAGSGKTFKLSNRYIALLLSGIPEEKILASTFTVKAAGEILARILRRLAEAALSKKEAEELKERLADDFGQEFADANADTNEIELQRITARLARTLYRLRIITLDSFFNKIASSFPLELSLPPNWTILEDDAFTRILREAVRKVLMEHSGKVSSLLHLLNEGDSSLKISDELVDLAKDYLPLVREVQDRPEVWEHTELLRKELPDDEFQHYIEKLQRADVPLTKTNKPDSRFVKARDTLVPLIETGNWEKFIKNGFVEKIISEDEPKYYGIPIDGDWSDSVSAFIHNAKAFLIDKLVGKTKATGDLLSLIAEQYETLLYRSGRYRFEDITEKVCRAALTPSTLTHRLDSETEHLLLDEFQDTSLPQWKILEPFARNAAAGGAEKKGSVFVVGDVKQAIYAWRGGVAEIFQTVQSKIKMEEKPLNDSWRSAQAVIDTVNELFGSIENNEIIQGGDKENNDYVIAANRWKTGWQHHETKKSYSGYCSLELIPDHKSKDNSGSDGDTEEDGGEDETAASFLETAANRIAEVHLAKPLSAIGVLVRNNKTISPIITALRKRNIEASEEGGNPLPFDSAAVRIVLSALLLADHPGDSVARFHVADSPLGEFCGLIKYRSSINDGTYNKYGWSSESVSWSRKIRRQVLESGLESVIKDLTEELDTKMNLRQDFPREQQRLEQLAGLALQFDNEAAENRLSRFIEKAKTAKVAGAAGKAAITVTTIHKSKGLEYDIVVLPELNDPIVKKSQKIVVSRKSTEKEPVGPVDFIIRYANAGLQKLLPQTYQEAFAERIRGDIVQSLNLLYVAITRPKYELLMLVPHKITEDSKGKISADKHTSTTFGNVLLKGLVRGIEGEYQTGILYTCGNKNWYPEFEKEKQKEKQKDAEKKEKLKKEELEPLEKITLKSEDKKHSFLRLTPSSTERQTVKPLTEETSEDTIENISAAMPVEQFYRQRSEAQLRGTAIHKCFEYVLNKNPWLEGTLPDKEELLQNVPDAQTGGLDWNEITASFETMCRSGNIKSALSRSAYPADEEVETEHERRFTVKVKNKDEYRIINGIIDRLVIRRKNGKIAAVEIIDFKSDNTVRSEFYLPQMQMYRKSMAELYRLDESNISIKLLFAAAGEVVSV